MKVYSAVIERCPQTGLFVGFVPGFPGAHSQGETLDEVNHNLHDVISMLLEDGEPVLESEFVGVQNVAVAWVMGNIPVLKPNEVIAILIKLGFSEVRQRGSHKQFRDTAGRCTTVPFHQGRDISPILLRQIAKDIGLALDEFLKHKWQRGFPDSEISGSLWKTAGGGYLSGLIYLPWMVQYQRGSLHFCRIYSICRNWPSWHSQYQRLVDSGELEKLLVDEPSPQMRMGSKVLGLTLIAIGLTLLALVSIGFLGGAWCPAGARTYLIPFFE